MNAFGAVIREVREARGLSQVDLARIIGRDAPIVCRWEGGSRQPGPTSIKRLIAKLQLTDDESSRLLTAMFFPGETARATISGGSVIVKRGTQSDDREAVAA